MLLFLMVHAHKYSLIYSRYSHYFICDQNVSLIDSDITQDIYDN